MTSVNAANRFWRPLTFFVVSLAAIYAAGVLYANFSRHRSTHDGRTPRSEMHVLVTALISYEYEYGAFPSSLSALGGAEKESSLSAAGLIDSALASGHKIGYIFLYKPAASKRNGRNDLFMITADPDDKQNPSLPHYFVDQTGVIRVEMNAHASANSAPVTY